MALRHCGALKDGNVNAETSPRAVAADGEVGIALTAASRPPSLKLVTETPIAAPSTVLLAIKAPSKANSAYSATSRTSLTALPSMWMLEAALPRTAEKAQLLMRLPRTITLPARKT